MKKIIFILSLLISSFAFGQSIGYWRYDTIMLQKIGGNSELNILNGTRSVIGGVLTNVGNGRTRFVLPTAVTVTGAENGDTLISGLIGLGGTGIRNTTINWNAFTQTQTWTNLGANSGLSLTGTGTASSNTNTIFSVGTSGTTSIGQTTYGAQISNTRTGTGGNNVALRLNAVGKTGASHALIIDSGWVGIGENIPSGKLHIRNNNMHDSLFIPAGIILGNDSAATPSYSQASPPITFAGQGWDSTSVLSRGSLFKMYWLPDKRLSGYGGRFRFMFDPVTSNHIDVLGIGSEGQLYDAAGSAGTVGQVPVSAGGSAAWAWGAGGGSSDITVGTTVINSGTDTRILYNNSGVVGEYTLTGTGTVVAMQTAPTFITSATVPLVIGGTGTTSTLTLQSTSGVGTTNADIIFKVGNNGATEAMRIFHEGSTRMNNAANSFTNALAIKSLNATLEKGIIVFSNNELNYTQYGSSRINSSSTLYLDGTTQLFQITQTTKMRLNSTGLFLGTDGTPTSYLHLAAGTTTIAPFGLTSGTNLTTPVPGKLEYNGTNLFFTRTGTTRESIITANAVNAVSPTAPDRTITVVIDGTTYYIAAKTTND